MIVVLDNIRSAMNVGSIIRTSDSLGIKEIFLCGITPGPENERVKKTSLGAEKNIKIRYFSNNKEVLRYLLDNKIDIYCLEITPSAIDIKNSRAGSPFALIVGNEVSGVSDVFLDAAKEVYFIPMKGEKESLNVSVAFGIAAYKLLNHF
jgi:23S rRNA (guanosine2251-2'-O)-methyltransferase